MNSPVKKIGIPGIAVAIFVGIMLLLSFYFFYTIGKNRQIAEELGFRELNQLGLAMKSKDTLIRNMADHYSDSIVKTVMIPFSGSKGQKKDVKGLSLNRFEKSPFTKKIFIGFKSALDTTDGLIYAVKDTIVKKNKKFCNDTIICKIKYRDFITPFLRKDFFSDFILIRDSIICFSTTETDLFIPPKEGEKSGKIKTSDSAYNKFIQSGSIYKVKIQGRKFNLFLAPMKFHGDHNNKGFIGGLIPEEKTSAWERDLPVTWIIIIMIVLLIILFSLPILKIFISGVNEKISRALVILVGSSIVIGIFLIIIFSTDMLIEFKTKTETNRNLELLNDTILSTFNRECRIIRQQLKAYDSIGRKTYKGSIKSLFSNDTIDTVYLPAYRFFKTMFWADSNGEQPFFITPYGTSSSSKVGYRNYFRNPEVYQDTTGKDTIWYNMEPIYSNTSGEWILAFSTPAKDWPRDKIVAITSWMYSIKSTILPQDYEYCLVEKSGKIWYHSKEIYNLTDDLLKECDNENLNAAFNSNSRDFLNITLRNSRYWVYIAPVNGTNLFLVTMFNPAKLKSMEAITAASAILYFGIIALLLLICYLLLKLGSLKNSLLEGSDFFFNWLIPVERKKEIYGSLLVINIILAIIFLIAGLSGFVRLMSLTWVLLGLLILIMCNFIVTYLLLNLQPLPNQETSNNVRTRILRSIEKFVTPVSKFFYCWIGYANVYKKDVRNLYTSCMVSWIVVTTVFPAIIFMVRFHHEETKLYVIDEFQGIADKLNHRTDSLAKFYQENIPLHYGDSLFYQRDLHGLYFRTIWKITVDNAKEPKSGKREQNDTAAVVHQVHFFFNKLMGDLESSGINPLLESKIHVTDTSFGIIFKRLLVDYPVKVGRDTIRPAKRIIFKGINTATKDELGIFKLFDKGWSSWIFALLIALVLLFLHLLIRKISHKLFDYDDLEEKLPALETQLTRLESTDWNAIIVSLNELDINEQHIGNWKFIDLNDIESINKKPSEKLILCNIESNLLKPEEISHSVKALEKFLLKKPVVLFLRRTPGQIVESSLEWWKSTNNENKEKEVANSGFIKLTEGLEYFQKTILRLPVYFVQPRPWENSYAEPLKDILKWESIINPDIKNQVPVLKSIITESKPEEKIILKIQELSIARYSYIWNCLSKEEHFILYQLAKGAMLNLNNREANRLLFNKGLLRLDGHVKIVSEAFKNFILTTVDLTDIELIEKQSIKTGSWSRVRLPVMLIAASIIIFLFATQQNVFSNLNAILLSVATLLGVYLKFSGLFVQGNK